jgi:hypothetical protein
VSFYFNEVLKMAKQRQGTTGKSGQSSLWGNEVFRATVITVAAVLGVVILLVVLVNAITGGNDSKSNRSSGGSVPLATPTPADTLETWKANPQYQNPATVAYDELFRNSEKYKGQFVRLKGEVVQVLGNPGDWNLRVNVTEKGSYGYTYYMDTVFVFSYSPDRVIEKDIIEFTAKANGVYTYESGLGASITIPSFTAFETPVVGRKE